MFLALRDLRAARGRFALITVTVAMMALLVSFLSGLTGGLTHQSISALSTIGGASATLSDTGEASLDRSRLDPESTTALLDAAAAAGTPATAVGIDRSLLGEESVSVLATRPAADGPADASTPLPGPGHVVLSEAAAKATGLAAGDSTDLGRYGTVTVDAVRGDDHYSHQPVVWAHLDADAPATFIASGAPIDAVPGTLGISAGDLPGTMASHKAESTSLTMINVMLLIITALVTGAFFTVWTIQRKPDIATLKALGATSTALVVDALGQAAVILAVGVGAGLGLTLISASLIGDGLPFVVSTSTTLYPALAMFALGLVGAAAALSFLKSASPLSALGGNR
ncbi:ABC transporter permease [Corynebacterium sp. TAE3-ERU16]|uniref:ABC transporter permease n=1 Tax=Corynebacterium sp. TAE3-ERU16 TaxID=2849493 RepID=UPI001C4379FD|nr:ABC transporter permease [Corynebacterium sp. TAE3-ERU16]MBV7294060.1 ABC transporter permease [Corynebacterium sp. TAE3-ERU16]